MSSTSKKILFVSHDASRTGAPMALLNLIKWIRAHSSLNFRILLRAGGPLEPEFRALGETHVLKDACGNPALVRDISLIFSNTCTNSYFIETLPYGTIPVITHVHEMQAVIESYGVENFRVMQKQTTHFIACSEAVSEGLLRLRISGEKISTIHSSIPTEEVLAKSTEKTREQIQLWHGWESYEHIVAACGVADWRKGADLFVQVAQAVKQKLAGKTKILFLWIGILPSDERGKLLANDVRQLGLEDTVYFPGEQTNPYPYLAAADVFCLTSREDPFPLVMLEGAALGKPIVCFQNSGGGEEFCKRGGGVTVPFLNIDAMADAILCLVEKEDVRKGLGATAAKIVAENFDFSINAPRFLCEIEKHARKISTPAVGNAQVYFPSCDGYSESNSKRIRVPPSRWVRLRVEIPPDSISREDAILLDPITKPSLIEVAGITFKSKAGKILWRCKVKDFGQIPIPSGVIIPDSRVLKFISFDTEARLAVVIPEHCRLEESLTLEWWQRISVDLVELALACRDLRDSHILVVPPPVEPITEPLAEPIASLVDTIAPAVEPIAPPVEAIAPLPAAVIELPPPPSVPGALEENATSEKPLKNSKALRFVRKFLKN